MAFRKLQQRELNQIKPLETGATKTPSATPTGLGGLSTILTPEVLGLGVLKGDVSTDEAKFLGDIFGTIPGEAAQESQASLQNIGGTLAKLKDITGMLETPQRISGTIPGLQTRFFKGLSPQGLLGFLAPSQQTNLLEAGIADYNTRLFEIAGKAFTGPERSLLEGLVLNIGDSEERMKDKITQAQKLLQRKQVDIIFGEM